jgi:ATP-binding cassette subfamily B protein
VVLRDFFVRLPLIRRGLVLVWGAARLWTICWAILLLVQGLLPVAQIAITRTVVNSLAALTSGHLGQQAARGAVLAPAVLLALLWIAGQWLGSIISWVRTNQAEHVQDHIHFMIHRKAMSLDLAFFENSESYDLLHRARYEATQQPLALLEHIGGIIQSAISVLALSSLLIVYAPILPVILILSSIPGLWAIARYTWREHRWRMLTTVDERKARYFDWMLTERHSAAEMRLFDLGEYHQNNFLKVRRKLREGRLRMAREQLISNLAAGSLTWFGGLLGMAWMMARTFMGRCSLGDVVMAYQALQQGQRLMHSFLDSAGYIYRSLLFLDDLFEFLSLQPKITETDERSLTPVVIEKELRFENVTFAYPGCERPALEEFAVTLPAGRMTAIVGENGAGKSTLIKLLCRFYDPQQGRVSLDGVDLRRFAAGDLRQKVTVLFQEPVRYHTTAAENIAMGDLPGQPKADAIRAAARAAGADRPIETLPQGYETVLGRWFGGAELSAGEWQRIALARAFLRKGDIIILDEPTSAMDSWAEADWLSRLQKLTKGCTTIIITHRFTTAMRADEIHVMQQGRIIESGTHAELVASGGHYAGSWRAQMKAADRG